jgi:8-oxo-dGTP pyrophosphatase MutT (NUDIX family)
MSNASKFYAGGFLYNPETKSVLLHKRDGKTNRNPNKWSFFGGEGEENETPEECFMREFKEELGIEFVKSELIPLCNYLNKEFNTYRHIFFIESERDKSEMTLGEGADFDWIPLGKAFQYDLTRHTKKDLETFTSRLQNS